MEESKEIEWQATKAVSVQRRMLAPAAFIFRDHGKQ
jgi:hypothetical protein